MRPDRSKCLPCLRGLADKTIEFSGGGDKLKKDCHEIIDRLIEKGLPPPEISSTFLEFVREKTGVRDPFFSIKKRELEEAQDLIKRFFPVKKNLLNLFELSAMGNSSDYFIENPFFKVKECFLNDMDKLIDEVYIKKKGVLILGDNMMDFVFDLPLMEFFESLGREVFYVVKKVPVQNDLSMEDVRIFGLMSPKLTTIIEGTDYVGIKHGDLEDILNRLGNVETIIAKGMANYETLSEDNRGHSIIHVMKVKCEPVAKSVGSDKGSYIVKIMGG